MNISVGEAVLILIVYVLCLARLTRLINGDRVFDWLRLIPARKMREAQMEYAEASAHGQGQRAARAADRVRRWDTVLYFVQCPWCVGMWFSIASASVPVWIIGWPWWYFPALGLAASHLIGVCARFADTEEIEIEDGTDTT